MAVLAIWWRGTIAGIAALTAVKAQPVRTGRASLRSLGVFSNRHLLAAIGGELVLAAALVHTPGAQALLGTSALPWHDLVLLIPYPLIVWGADGLRRLLLRRWHASRRVPEHAARADDGE